MGRRKSGPATKQHAGEEPADQLIGTRAAKAAQTRQHLISAAIELFSAHAYEDVAVADIARAAGVAHGLLFHHFGTKRGLYIAALQAAVARMNASFAAPESGPREQIRAAMVHRLRYLAEHRGLALRVVLGGRGTDPEAWAVFEGARWNVLMAAGNLLGLDSHDPTLRMVGRSIAAIFDEMTVQWLDNHQQPSVDRIVDWIIASAIACLRSAPLLSPDLRLEQAIEALEGGSRVPELPG